jgi:uncharacterized GH25 family protein
MNYASGRPVDAPRRRTALGVVVLGLAATMFAATYASAHDFWLQPSSFRVSPGQSVSISMQVGHGQARQRWAVSNDRVLMLRRTGPDGATDLKPALRQAGEADLALPFPAPGVQVLSMASSHAQSELLAIRFNDYLKEEGLTPAMRVRDAQRQTNAPGREIYSRRAKSLVLVGPSGAADDARVTRPLGLTLEIVPDRNPYTLKPGEGLPVRVFYEGRTLPGATVKLTNLDFDMKPLATKTTDAAGRAVFDVPRSGRWLLNVVWTRPIKGDPRGDFDTTFSSLTFGSAG